METVKPSAVGVTVPKVGVKAAASVVEKLMDDDATVP
jgi:hypothetical protein